MIEFHSSDRLYSEQMTSRDENKNAFFAFFVGVKNFFFFKFLVDWLFSFHKNFILLREHF